MYFIGIDIGTGSTKAVAVEPSGAVLITSQAPYPTLNPSPGISEQMPEIIWQAFVKCIFRITSALTDPPVAICLSSAMHSLILADDAGTPLANMITWADNRSAEVATTLKNSSVGRKLYEETGTPIHAMSPLSKILWLKDNETELYQQASKFISIKEYIWFKLFNVFEVDYSIASATGLFNIKTLKWHDQALSLAGISERKLSLPVNTNYFRSGLPIEKAQLLSLSADTLFMIGSSDGCLANVGSYATDPGVAALTIGTSGAIRVAGTNPAVNWEQMTFNYRLNEKMFISGGPINNGGIALKWYAKSLLKLSLDTKADYTNLLTALNTIPAGCEGLIFLPYIQGERAPIWNSESYGVFFGITAQHTQEHFTKAVIEGILFSLFQISRGIEASGQPINQIHVSGGFVSSHDWVQLLANIFGKKVYLVNQDDASAIGAAFMGMSSMGVEGPYKEFDKRKALLFHPDMEDHSFYVERSFPLYEHLYKSLILDMQILHEQKVNPTL